jgi:hypothetical protein
MPTRMIRDGILDSERYWSVTIESRQLFFHLMLLADDFGCVNLAPLFVRRRCFNDSPSTEKIARLITELGDADLIRCYEIDRCCYAFIPRFRQRLQRATLKHPKPPQELLIEDADAIAKFNKIKQESSNPTVSQPLPTVGQPPEVKRREEKRSTSMSGKPSVKTLVDLGVNEQVANDWLSVRRAKKAPLTNTVIASLKSEAQKAGISVAQAVAVCAERSWQGFKATWLEVEQSTTGPKNVIP